MISRLTLGRWGAGLTAVVFAVLSMCWIFNPGWTTHLFGPIRLEGAQLAYARVKGFEDLLVAVMLFVTLRGDQQGALPAALCVALLAPIGDAVALVSAGVRDPSSLLTHVFFVLWMGAIAILARSGPSRGAPGSHTNGPYS
jgi:hypothetical protein